LTGAEESGQEKGAEEVVMERRDGGAQSPHHGREPDVVQYCPNCGARGVWQKCKLICATEHCSVQIILACVD